MSRDRYMTCYDHLYNKEYYGSELTANHLSKEELSWRILPKGMILPHTEIRGEFLGGLVDESGKFTDGSHIHRGMGGAYPVAEEDIEKRDEDIVFLGVRPDVWGHCLTDNIRRLWVLNNAEFMSRYGDLRFIYVPFRNIEPGSSFRELLNIIGAEKIRLEPVSNVTRFRKVILPDECFWREADGTRIFTAEYGDMIESVRRYAKEETAPSEAKKIYFTYRNYTDFRCVGERQLEKFFSGLGYRIVYPEDHSLAEQLSMLLGCEEFAATVGSLSHNSIFLPEGTKVYLIPRSGFISEYQLALDQVQNLDIKYIDSSLSLYVKPGRQWEGPFYYILSRQLKETFGVKGRYRERKIPFRAYRALAYAMNQIAEPLDYYGCVLGDYLTVEPEWRGRETAAVKLLRRPRVRRLINRLMG